MNKTISIMQPYFFPYMGYFDLLTHSNVLVLYDDAAFSKNTWYNRNRIAGIENDWDYIGVSVRKAPLGTASKDIMLANKKQDYEKIMGQLRRYSKTPHFSAITQLVDSAFKCSDDTLGSLSTASIKACAAYMGLSCNVILSSNIDYDRDAPAVEKIWQICAKIKTQTYLNLSGGRELYHRRDFIERGIELEFCSTSPVVYATVGRPFIPFLSVLDGLTWMSPERARELLKSRPPSL